MIMIFLYIYLHFVLCFCFLGYSEQVHLGDTPNNLSESDFESLGRKTEGFSGSDVAVCVSTNHFNFACISTWLLPVF